MALDPESQEGNWTAGHLHTFAAAAQSALKAELAEASKIIDGLVKANTKARAAQAQAEGAATKAVDAIWDCAEKFWEDARQANAEGDAEEERRAMAVHNYLAARWWNLSRTVPPSPRRRLETGRPQRPRRPERSPAPMAEPAETIATLEVGCLCRLQFAQEHPNHAFLGPCVHEQLAEATAAQSALKAELAEARGEVSHLEAIVADERGALDSIASNEEIVDLTCGCRIRRAAFLATCVQHGHKAENCTCGHSIAEHRDFAPFPCGRCDCRCPVYDTNEGLHHGTY